MRHVLIALGLLVAQLGLPWSIAPSDCYFSGLPDPHTSTLALLAANSAFSGGAGGIAFRVTIRDECSSPVPGFPIHLYSHNGTYPGDPAPDTFVPLSADRTGLNGSVDFLLRSTASGENSIGLYCDTNGLNCWTDRLSVTFVTPAASLFLPLLASQTQP